MGSCCSTLSTCQKSTTKAIHFRATIDLPFDELSDLEFASRLNVNTPLSMFRLTGVICTIGPASNDVPTLQNMIHRGMNIARLNLSYESHEYHAETIKNIRQAEGLSTGPLLAIALDTKGPEIRTGFLKADLTPEVTLQEGNTIKITTNEKFKEACSEDILYVNYINIINIMKVNDRIYIDDGLIYVKVKEKCNDCLVCEIVYGGSLGSYKRCNLPGVPIDLPTVSEKDKDDILFGVEQNVDMIFASFVRDAGGIKTIKRILGEQGTEIKVIAKIEDKQGIINIDEIIREADGIMVERGNMGIEIPPEKVFLAQKLIIKKCNLAGKAVICATEMLESMASKPRPTRAEASDVANAVLDGADCVMLSGETAKGNYPVQTVMMMDTICKQTEAMIFYGQFFQELLEEVPTPLPANKTVALSVVAASFKIGAVAIIVLSKTGKSAELISTYHPACPILMVTRYERVARQAFLYRGVLPIYCTEPKDSNWIVDVDKRILKAMYVGFERNIIYSRSPLLVVSGWKANEGATNSMKLLIAPETPSKELKGFESFVDMQMKHGIL